MRLSMELTLDGLVRTLRRGADRRAEDIEENRDDRARATSRQAGWSRGRYAREDDDDGAGL